MSKYIIAGLASVAVIGSFLAYDRIFSDEPRMEAAILLPVEEPLAEGASLQKTPEELFQEALERSANAKGVYMTGAVANDQGRPATNLRSSLVALLDTTELNAVVIDVKEVKGSEVTKNLQPFVEELQKKGVWTIARITTFRDDSQTKTHPEYYLKRVNGAIWKDNRGGMWLDPASEGARTYLIDFAKSIIDIGFDELQFDYVRFPSDGDVRSIVFPAHDPKTPKYVTLKSFFEYANAELKRHKPDIILSADLFGYVATNNNDLGIGQRIEDIGNNFDYVSFMIYPSHYYSGFQMPADPARGLPAIYYPYRGKNVSQLVSNQPYDVIHRSMLYAGDVLAGRVATSSMASVNKKATTTPPVSAVASTSPMGGEPFVATPISRARLRPWLQDFDLGADTARGIYYDAKKVRAQIDAAEAAGTLGWLLWNPGNVYTKEALKVE
ncbi:MAG: hypothetical protein A3I44_00425 [Candidatus Sungbacteria bacterium RIFCSPLOWO2_02_FULL_51_17]|uniref:DUF4015 domain-containing protein n=1 Tax=Candidatus Sungbacteria bacterium RIFCSPHIGHO2_02_FULL_51_29 TaxID=1802273 RepID=A0A1G2KPU5_9BACT|nr:MAG: hypothetical protein A2676_04805 [Candidatus Sungbacteria bacterium RIFCSPHIGHO2_01_FULL_51_22]OHA01274.1 MAG: hypothetical protein A3C16_01895 [Candidatus Sungbacteria bacterium RIFCSPHIGHO2_02_FULL_51_29]OHA07776.1 MAG: hypothetical protein A3B29_00625 [Candidatus Sungbacteria bacterium RIFCSPLOWO2_01_FULL_51_34]OHA12559.1 MAG: hypothetical protein A3I44_00425 [Candidatus Sungbacteria bacterium RIFCSPLOWO2_02_FULL_51_17]